MSTSESLQGSWLQIKGVVQQKWGKLTDDELTEINGSKDKLMGKLISLYDLSKEEAQAEVDRIWG